MFLRDFRRRLRFKALGTLTSYCLLTKSEDVSAVTKSLRIDENDKDDETKGCEGDSRDAEDLEVSAQDSAWGVPTTMSW